MDYIFIAISVVLNSFAQIIQKTSAKKNKNQKNFSKSLMKDINFYIAAFIYSISTLFWTFSVKHIPLSIATPLTSLSIVVVIILSKFILKEKIPRNRIIGISAIMIGIVLISI